jgi:glycosyltransferase involved in cell wall biosynthesis
MRVLYCTDTFPPQVNGVSVVTELSVGGLGARGWDVRVVAPGYPRNGQGVFGDHGTAVAPAAPVTSLPSASLPIYPDVRLSLPDYFAVRRAIERFEPDLVHCTTEFIIGRLGQMAAARAGIPIVTSYHTDFGKYAKAYGAPWLAPSVSRYLARFHRRALRTFTPSGPARNELWRLGVRDVEVWGRGVDAVRFHPSHRSAGLRTKLGTNDAFTFLYVGRLAAEKNVRVLLEAYRLCAARLPAGSVRLVIAGEGPEEPALRNEAPPGTVFLGYLDRTHELPALYASCDAFIFASTTETLGLVVLEAMAAGIPVVAAPAGGVADHLRNGENGLAYAANDAAACANAMHRLAIDRNLVVRLRAGARRTAQALTWDSELDRLDTSYREVCASDTACELVQKA